MKDGWTSKPLGEICDILDNQRKPITKRDRTAGEYPYYGATGVVDYVNDFIFDEPLVLVGEDGAKWESGENTAFTIEGKCWVNNHAHVLRPHRKTVVDNWLVHYLNHSDLTEFVGGLTVPKLNQGSLREIPIPVPPLAEQQRIVGVLDESFAGLATAQAHAAQNLQNARALFESHLQSVFTHRGKGWVEKRLGDLIEIQNGFAFKSDDYTDTGYFVIRIGNVQDGEITLDNPRFIKLADQKLERFVLNAGDILVSLTGNIGRVGIIQDDHLPAVLNQRVARVTLKSGDANREFVFRFLCSRTFREELQEAGHGAAQQNVSTKEIESVAISLPDLKEQRLIAAHLEALATETQNLARLYEQKLAALAELKKSLLHQAFSGEL
jgi:type I restriction enzyme S subunit